MKFLSIDSPFMQGLNKIADLIILNLLTIVCCIPIFTIGAAITALNYQVLKIIRDEECYVVKGYFKSFKENFKQSTIIWLIMGLIMGLLIGDFVILQSPDVELPVLVPIAMLAIFVFAAFLITYVFWLQAKFVNTVRATMKNAMMLSIAHFPKTILMIVANLVPVFISIWRIEAFPLVLFFGFSLPAYWGAFLNNKFFLKMEEKILEESGENKPAEDGESEEDEDEKIFHDKLDEALQDKTPQ